MGGPVPLSLFLKVLILSMCERRPEGRELCGLSCRGGVGTNCIERCVLPNEVRKEMGPEGRDGGWTQDPPGGPKVPVWHVCPQQGQRWAAPTCLFCPPCGLSTSSLLSLANIVGGDGRRSPRLALVAGSRGLGRGGLAGWPTLSILPICWCWAGTRPGLPGLWVMAGSSGRRRAAGSRPSAAGATETHSSHLLSSWLGRVFLFLFVLCPFLLLSFPSSWESAGGFSLHLIFHQKCRLGLSPWDSTGDGGGVGRQPRLPQVPGLSRKRIPPS